MKRASVDDDEDVVRFPSAPNRVRNILTIEERVRAIQAYDKKPMYTRVAKMFNCSWEQIKNIIVNRESIMRYYESTRPHIAPTVTEMQSSKLNFFNECVYEYIQRVQFHRHQDVTEELIRHTANQFREVLKVENIVPNKAWMNKFKTHYKFSLSNRQVVLTHLPPESLEAKDIISYCLKKRKVHIPAPEPTPKPHPIVLNKQHTKQSKPNPTDPCEVRKRKMQFLERALWEYLERVKYHHARSPRLTEIISTASELKQILKIDDFEPNSSWLREFRQFLDEMASKTDNRQQRPPFSLDLKDIISYCSRENAEKRKPTTITLQPKEHIRRFVPTPNPTTVETIIPENVDYVDLEMLDGDDDVKPFVQQIEEPTNQIQPPPFKIQKIESGKEVQYGSDDHSLSPADSPILAANEQQNDSLPLPNPVLNYSDAMKLLKPLEEFVMLEANYRAIGLIGQLETIFKKPTKKEDELDEED